MKPRDEMHAGIFIFVGITIFVLGILFIGGERQIFARNVQYFVNFGDVKGLAEGAPVRLGGITIGRINDIGFTDDLNAPSIQVSLLINSKYLTHLRTGSEVSIETQGLLGDKYLSISSRMSTEQLKKGGTLKSREAADIADVLEKAGLVVDNTVQISENINAFITELRTDTLKNLSVGAKNLARRVNFMYIMEANHSDSLRLNHETFRPNM